MGKDNYSSQAERQWIHTLSLLFVTQTEHWSNVFSNIKVDKYSHLASCLCLWIIKWFNHLRKCIRLSTLDLKNKGEERYVIVGRGIKKCFITNFSLTCTFVIEFFLGGRGQIKERNSRMSWFTNLLTLLVPPGVHQFLGCSSCQGWLWPQKMLSHLEEHFDRYQPPLWHHWRGRAENKTMVDQEWQACQFICSS